MVGDNRFGRGTGQEWLGGVVDVLQVAAKEQGVFARAVKVIVEPGDERVVIEFDGSAEAVAGIVIAVAHGKIIRDQIGESVVEISQHVRIGAGHDPGIGQRRHRIHSRDLLRRQSKISSRNRIGSVA